VQAASETDDGVQGGFSLVTGGPFYRLLCRTRLVRAGTFAAMRPALAAWLLTWGMLAVLVGAERIASRHFDPVLADFGVVARLWVAIPLFFVAESELHIRLTRSMHQFDRGQFARGDVASAVDRLLRSAERLRDARWLELGLLVVVVAAGLASLTTPSANPGILRDATPGAPSLARFWYAVIALPLFRFLCARWLWRWLIWSYVLVGLSRLRLCLVATHPDRAGGIGLLAAPTYAFAIFIAGMSAVAAGTWSTQVEQWRTALNAYAGPSMLLAVVALLLAFCALSTFAFQLRRARFDGLHDYGHLALVHNRLFHRRWVERPDNDALLGAPEISSLADLQAAHNCMAQIRLVPYSPREMLAVLLGVALPMLPLILIAIPMKELVQKLANALLAGLP
jgi:hypothetical protein